MWQGQHHTAKMNIFPTAILRKPYGNPTELQDFKHPMSLQAYLCVMGVNLTVLLYIYIYIYIYTSVNPRISILVLDEAEGSDAELSGAVIASLNNFFE